MPKHPENELVETLESLRRTIRYSMARYRMPELPIFAEIDNLIKIHLDRAEHR